MNFEKYDSSLSYSYVFGAFGTIELLENKPSLCLAVLIDSSFVKNEAFCKIKELANKHHIELVIDDKIIGRIRDKGNIFVIGVFQKYASELNNKKHIVLYHIHDEGVIGTIIRSMRGFSFENLALVDCSVDLFHEHLIRSTMGAFFQTNMKAYASIDDYLKEFPDKKIYCISKDKGNDVSSIPNNDLVSLLFTEDKINDNSFNFILLDKDLSLDHIVNIVLFSLYSK